MSTVVTTTEGEPVEVVTTGNDTDCCCDVVCPDRFLIGQAPAATISMTVTAEDPGDVCLGCLPESDEGSRQDDNPNNDFWEFITSCPNMGGGTYDNSFDLKCLDGVFELTPVTGFCGFFPTIPFTIVSYTPSPFELVVRGSSCYLSGDCGEFPVLFTFTD